MKTCISIFAVRNLAVENNIPVLGPSIDVVGKPALRRTLAALAVALGTCLLPVSAYAQSVEWAQAAGSAGVDNGTAIAVDASGNSYVTGGFSDMATFGSITLTSLGDRDVFLAKYDASGNPLWAQAVGGGTGFDSGLGVGLDASGNIYVTGFYVGTATLGSQMLTSAGSWDTFVAKFDSAGNMLWVRSVGGTADDEPRGIAVDVNGNSYVTGFYGGTATFGSLMLTSAGDRDVFTAKYDSSGNILWVQSGGSASFDDPGGVAVDAAGNVYVTGRFAGTTTFGTLMLASMGLQDIFVAKYDSDGNIQWIQGAGSGSNDSGAGISVDANGNVYVTGAFQDAATFGSLTVTSAGSSDVFLAKYDSAGNILWVHSAGGTSDDTGFGISIDPNGASYVTGSFTSVATFDSSMVTSAGLHDIFAAKYDTDGNVLWVQSAGGPSDDFGRGISVDRCGHSYVTGFFEGSATVGSIGLTSAGAHDILVAKYTTGTCVNFDAIDASNGPVEIGSMFQTQGVVFQDLWALDVSTVPFFTSGPPHGVVTLPIVANLNDEPPFSQTATARFVDSATGLPGTTSSIGFDVFDSNVGTTAISVTAYAANNSLLYTETFVTPPEQRLHVLIPASDVSRIEFATDVDGSAIDNLQFGEVQATSGPVCAPPPSGLVSWWPGDVDANDINGRFDGALMNGTQAGSAGLVDGAFSFDGVDDFVQISSPVINHPPYSVDAWVNPTTTMPGVPKYVVANGGETGAGFGFTLFLRPAAEGGPDWCYIVHDNVAHKQASVCTGPVSSGWTHLAGTWDGTLDADSVRLYINGTLAGTDTPQNNTRPEAVSRDLRIGFSSVNSGFNVQWEGLIDEVEVFNRVLSAAEVHAIFLAGSAGKCKAQCVSPPPNLRGWWTGDADTSNLFDPFGLSDGVLMGGAQAGVPGHVDGAFDLDGVDDFVEIPETGLFDLNGDFTIDAWIAPRSLSDEPIVTKWNNFIGERAISFGIRLGGGLQANVSCPGANMYVQSIDAVVQPDVFSHVAVVYRQNIPSLEIYVNGVVQPVQATSADTCSSINQVNTPLWIGKRRDFGSGGAIAYFNGLVDEVDVFNRALSANEVQAIFLAGSAGKCKPQCVDPSPNLIGWWAGEGDASDILGGNNGTLENGASIDAGIVGQAFRFDNPIEGASNQSVRIPNGPTLNVSHLTMELWVYPFSLPNAAPKPLWRPTAVGQTQYGIAIDQASGLANCNINSVGLLGGAVPLNQWTHIACTYDLATMRLFVNGVEVDSRANTQPIPNSSQDLWIGAEDGLQSNLRHFDGLIDEPSIYARALSPAEIQSIFEAGSAGKCKPAIDDCNANDIADSDDIATQGSEDCNTNGIPDECEIDATSTAPGGPFFCTSNCDPDCNANGVPDMCEVDNVGATVLDFDGIDDFVAVPDSASLRFAGPYTVEAWVFVDTRPLDGASDGLVSKQIGDISLGGWSLVLGSSEDIWGFAHGGSGGSVSILAPISFGQWKHLAGVFDGSNIHFYVDAVEVAPPKPATPLLNTNADLLLGRQVVDEHSRFLDGKIDEVRVWNIARTQSNIHADMNRRLTGSEPGLAGYWPLEAGTGTTVFDHTLNGNNGVLGAGVAVQQPTWVGSPMTHDCNTNGIPDECEIDIASPAPGGPFFCTLDCDLDCNDNGIPDECDLAGATDCVALPANLVGWWTGDADANDAAGQSDGVLTNGAVAGSPGLVDGAFRFDGVDDFVDLGKPVVLDIPGDKTVDLWVKLDTLSRFGYVFADFDAGGTFSQGGLTVGVGANRDAVGYYHAHTADSNTSFLNLNQTGAPILTTGRWFHLAFVRDDAAKTVRVYVDGSEYLSSSYDGTIVASSAVGNTTIGKAGSFPGDFVHGQVDEVEVFNRALSPAEIQSIFRAGSAGRCRGSAFDCNNNGVLDECDIADGTSFDDNTNGIPDECEIPPVIVDHSPTGFVSDVLAYLDVTFDSPIQGSSFGPEDVVLIGPAGGVTVSTVSAQGGLVYRINFPPQRTDGDYEFTVGPDILGEFGAPMDAAYTATVTVSLPDLLFADPITGIDAPTAGVGGEPFEVAWMITNAGVNDAAGPWEDRVYISTDNVFSGDDTLLTPTGVVFPGPLAPGESYERIQQLDLPSAAGDFWIIVVTDAAGAVGETNESNNVLVDDAPITVAPEPFTDLEVNSIIPPVSGVLSGTTANITYTVCNQGNLATQVTSWQDSVFLSVDPGLTYPGVPSPQDQILCNQEFAEQFFSNPSFLLPGDCYTQTLPFTLLEDRPGPWYAYVVTDRASCHSPGNVPEADETNNLTRSDVFQVELEPQPDLIASGLNFDPTVFSNKNFTVTWADENQDDGQTDSGMWTDAVYLSLDDLPSISADDLLLGTATRDGAVLQAGQSDTGLSLTERLPPDLQGPHFVKVQVDRSNQVSEFGFENNNVAVSATTVNVILSPPVNLFPTDLTSDSPLIPGHLFDVSWSAENIGAPAETVLDWVDGIYLSQDAEFDGADRLLRLEPHGTTEDGDTITLPAYSNTLTLRAPTDLVEGPLFILVVLDANEDVFENESQTANVVSTPVEVVFSPTDLTIELNFDADHQLPTSAAAGQPLTLSWRVTNTGLAVTPVSNWSDRVYFSTDEAIDNNDTILVTEPRTTVLQPGQSYVVERTVATPLVLPDPFFLLFKTDSANEVFEQAPGEGNNVAVGPFTVTSDGSDLQVSFINAPDTGQSGQPVHIEWTICNNGTMPTNGASWFDDVFLSTDAVVDEGDAFVGFRTRNTALGVGECYTTGGDFDIPIERSGMLNVIVATDTTNQVFETNETNNTFPKPMLINVDSFASDLTVTSIPPVDPGQSGQPLHVCWTVQNIGPTTTETNLWVDRVYLSVDDQLGGDDRLIGARTRSGFLAPGENYTACRDFGVPFDLSGAFHVLVKTDSDDDIFELDETNNTFAKPMLVNIDPALLSNLVITGVDADNAPVSGQPISVTWTVANTGVGATNVSSWRDAVYLSRDQFLDRPGDLFLGIHQHSGFLASGTSEPITQDFSIPLGASGPYFVFVVTDSSNQVVEDAEDDNIDRDTLLTQIIAPPPADLIVGAVTPPPPAVLGSMATFQWQITNNSDQAIAGGWHDSLYLSRDETWDLGDKLVGRFRTNPANGVLLSGESATNIVAAEVPAVTPGDYHVIVRSDVFNQIPETNEGNNIGASVSTVAVSAIPIELGTPFDTALNNGDSKYFELPAPAGETVRITLDHSSPAAWTELYVRFGEVPTPGQFDFVFDKPAQPDQEITIPTTQAGTYFILAKATTGAATSETTLLANALPFGISTLTPATVGNGVVTLTASGALLSQDTAFHLESEDSVDKFDPIRTVIESQSTAHVTFALTSAPTGSYRLVASNSHGNTEDSPASIEVVESSTFDFNLIIEGPSEQRVGQTLRKTIILRNESNVNIPYLSVLSETPGENVQTWVWNSNVGAAEQSLSGGRHRYHISYVIGLPPHEDILMNLAFRVPQSSTIESASVGINVQAFLPQEFALFELSPVVEAARQLVLRDLDTYPELVDLAGDSDAWWRSFVGSAIKGGYLSGLIPNSSAVARSGDRARQWGELGACTFIGLAGGAFLGPVGTLACSAAGVCELTDCSPDPPIPCPQWEVVADPNWRERCRQIRETCVKEIQPYSTEPLCTDILQQPCPRTKAVCNYWTRPRDPNAKNTVRGVGQEQWQARDRVLPYRVYFENLTDATAPAAAVRITDTLDASLNLGSFRVGDIHFGDTTVEVPDDSITFQTTVDLTATRGVMLNIVAGVNATTREAFWTFRSLDPQTGEFPTDASAGFLPPNDETGRGQGFVEYTIEPNPGVTTGTIVRNDATIVFDFNEPIDTNEVFNTLDADAPDSAVDPLPAASTVPDIPLTWSGSDPFDGSGVKGIAIFARLDDEPFASMIADTLDTTGLFENARGGGVYEFYSIATDNVGNVEQAPTTPDATTTVAVQVPFAPAVDVATATIVPLADLGMANVDRIEHAVFEENTAMYIGADGRLTDVPFWQPLDQWTGTIVRALAPNTEYRFRVKARSAADGETAPGPATAVTTSIQGDANGDTLVTQADVDLVQAVLGTQFGGLGFDPRADLNADDQVTFADLGIVLANIRKGDFNRDGMLRLDDFAVFQRCFTGQGSAGLTNECGQGDFDADDDIDLDDYSGLGFDRE